MAKSVDKSRDVEAAAEQEQQAKADKQQWGLENAQWPVWLVPVLAGVGVVLLVALIVFMALYFSAGTSSSKPSEPSTSDQCIPLRQCSRSFSQPPLVLVSMDGFKSTYFEKGLTSNIKRLFDCGTQAEYMTPTFPSKTFPNHYTAATGLLPSWHGIVDNRFYDPTHPEVLFLKPTKSTGWFKGEPIWMTVRKHGRISAAYFWVGSETPGNQPNIFMKYRRATPFTQRIDTLMQWLNYPDSTRPNLFLIYFEEPDRSGHIGGPESEEVRSALILMDGMMKYFTERLLAEGLMGCINLAIMSDHGFQKLNLSAAILLDDILPVGYTNYTAVTQGVVAGIFRRANATEGEPSPLEIVAPMKCKRGVDYLVYDKLLTPTRYHYGGSPRIGDVVIEGRPGIIFYRKVINMARQGDHGYDNRIANMRAVFAAVGPDVYERKRVEVFQNIELYNLFADLLRIPPAPSNGTRGVLFPFLKNPPPFVEPPTFNGDAPCVSTVSMLSCNSQCQADTSVATGCKAEFRSSVVLDVWNKGECIVQLCDATIHYNKQLNIVQMIETTISPSDWKNTAPGSCVSYIDSLPNTCAANLANGSTTISLFINKERYNTVDPARIMVTNAFANGVWQYLVSKIGAYVGAFGKVAMYAGPAYDKNADGVRDGDDVIKVTSPSRIFVVLIRCPSDPTSDPRFCADPLFVPFVLPIVDEDFNCLEPDEFLFQHMANIRDIEWISGFQFFADRSIWPFDKAIKLRTRLVQEMWSASA